MDDHSNINSNQVMDLLLLERQTEIKYTKNWILQGSAMNSMLLEKC